MKFKLLLILIFGYFISYGQDSTEVEYRDDIFSLDIIYGHYLLKNNFNSKINSQNNFSFSNPIQTLGISFSGAYKRGERHDYAIHLSYSQVIPQQIIINDAIKSEINGFIFGLNMLGKDLLPRSKNANCIVGFGFNSGRLRVSSEGYKQQKNPFFSPTLSIQPKINIGPIALSIRYDYSFDISKSNWRSVNFTNKSNVLNLTPLKQTGGIIYLSMGWFIGWESKK